MLLIRPLLIALSTYTRLPLPKVEFNEEDMKYSMCFFPLAGVLVGLVFWGWWHFSNWLQVGVLFRSAAFALIPLLVTGGIHMDGFLDVCDALASWQPKEKKLDIMKDPHMGAFAVIRCGMYLLAMLGIYSEIGSSRQAMLISLGFITSRSLVILMFNILPNARGSGMMQRFQQTQGKKAVLMAAGVFSLLAFAVGIKLLPVLFLLGMVAFALTSLWFRRVSMHQFGGITGDLAGFFVQVSELVFALVVLIAGRFV